MNLVFLLVAFFGMEFVAWFAHKYVMHGVLWVLHKDHHVKESKSFFERNDFFFLLFATPGMILIYLGFNYPELNYLFWLGLGIALYGFAYFMVHDVFIHQRFKFLRKTDNRYFRAVRRAHKMHHKHITKEDGECFGMLLFPFKYLKQQ